MQYNNYVNKYIYVDEYPRGRIYDRNNNLLVDNISVKTIFYEKGNNSTSDELKIIYELCDYIELDYESIDNRNLKEFFLILYSSYGDSLITDDEYLKLENRKLTSTDIYNLKIDRITDEDLNKLNDKDRKCAYLYYLMNKGYSYSKKIIKEDITDKEYAYILENSFKYSGFSVDISWKRNYIYSDCLKSIFGNISSIPKEDLSYYLNLGYSNDDLVGVSGLEKQYEEILHGRKSIYKVVNNKLILVEKGSAGSDIFLSIDINLQLKAEDILKNEISLTKKEANTEFYNKSFYIISNPKTGEILSLSGMMIENGSFFDITDLIFNYSITPGSVVKGASITVGYNTKVIDIGTIMKDECIKLYNTPAKCSWKSLGYIDDLTALKWSSNVYQYKIAMMVGGFDYSYGNKLDMDLSAFKIYRNTFYQYGLGVLTGVDFINEDNGYRGKSNNGELLINYAIGQYDTYTPMQLSQYISTIANSGVRVKPHFLKRVVNTNLGIDYNIDTVILNKVSIEDKYMKRIQDGFISVMYSGTGIGFISTNYRPAGKTGTSESFVDTNNDGFVDAESISNNFVGYAPYDNPTMSIITSSPDVQNPNRGNYKSDVNYRITRKISDLYFTLYDLDGNLR